MVDVEVVLLRLEELRGLHGLGGEGDELSDDLHSVMQRIEDRSQLERLVAGLPNAAEVAERADLVLTASSVERSDEELLGWAGEQIDAMVQRASAQLEPCTDDELGAFERLASLPIVVVGRVDAGDGRYCVDYGLGTAEGVVRSERDCDDIAECESGWPIYLEKMPPGWATVAGAFDRLAEDNFYLQRWVLAPATEGALLTEPMYEIWRAGAQLWVQGDRVAVVRGAADGVANVSYSPVAVVAPEAPVSMAAWVKEVGPIGKRVRKLANEAIKKSKESATTPLYLHLDGLELPSVPPAQDMADWDYLTISGSPGIDMRGVERYGSVTKLSLTGNELEAVPEQIRTMRTLDSLVVAENPIESLPEWLVELPELEGLGLGQTMLCDLPEFIADMPSLGTVLMNRNKLRHVPAALRGCTELRVLRLDDNEIIEVAGLGHEPDQA